MSCSVVAECYLDGEFGIPANASDPTWLVPERTFLPYANLNINNHCMYLFFFTIILFNKQTYVVVNSILPCTEWHAAPPIQLFTALYK